MTTLPAQPSVLVIGARGALGSLVADAFEKEGWLVRPAGRRPLPDASYRYVDLADPHTVPAALRDTDLVVTTVPDPRLTAERHVLTHGGRLLNLSAGPATHLEALRDLPAAAGTVVMNAGVAPGVTNLVAAALLEDHPDADEVELVFTVSLRGAGGPASGDFAHRGLVGCPRHRVTRVALPAPFGTRDVLGFAEQDRGWLGPVADPVGVRPHLCLSERPAQRLLLTLNRAGLVSRLPRRAFGRGRRTTVEDAGTEAVAHTITVLEDGRPLGAASVRGHGDFRMAAASAVVFARALFGPGSPRAGAWYPEEVVTLSEVRAGLRRAGVVVDGPRTTVDTTVVVVRQDRRLTDRR
jgi:hypothetical protein